MIKYCEAGFPNKRVENEFLARLSEAIAWNQFRNGFQEASQQMRRLDAFSRWGVLSSPDANVLSLSSERRRRLIASGISMNPSPPLTNGRLLAYFPEQELFDGVAEGNSGGFFDVHNAPPCDTWIDICQGNAEPPGYEDFLISWVPFDFVDAANEGIETNPEQCIIWLEKHVHPIVDALKSRGIL